MSLHKKERNKKMPTPRHKVLKPHTSLFALTHYIGKANSTTQHLDSLHENVRCSLKDVGMGL